MNEEIIKERELLRSMTIPNSTYKFWLRLLPSGSPNFTLPRFFTSQKHVSTLRGIKNHICTEHYTL